MATNYLYSIDLNNYGGSHPSGTIGLNLGDASMSIKLEEADCVELMALGWRIFERRQPSIARSVADMRPPALTGPNIVEGEFVDVRIDGDGVTF